MSRTYNHYWKRVKYVFGHRKCYLCRRNNCYFNSTWVIKWCTCCPVIVSSPNSDDLRRKMYIRNCYYRRQLRLIQLKRLSRYLTSKLDTFNIAISFENPEHKIYFAGYTIECIWVKRTWYYPLALNSADSINIAAIIIVFTHNTCV